MDEKEGHVYSGSGYSDTVDYCSCDFYTHAADTLLYDDEHDYAGMYCSAASSIVPDRTIELESLKTIYDEMGGEYWLNNTGWMTLPDHCDWHGVMCDEGKEYVIELHLPNNNLTGRFPSNHLSKLYKLKILELRDNNLWGTMAEVSSCSDECEGDKIAVNDTTVFFNLRDLVHVDLSQNNLSGEVDVLFAPALEYANFSHNNFTSINSFKKFKRSHQTLQICDVSHNYIGQSASDVMTNVPPNIEQMILSDNLFKGTIPTSLERLEKLRMLDMGRNMLSGVVPDFSASFPNLLVLELSNQSLMGTIPRSLANLPFLTTLNLAGNELTGQISPALGGFALLKSLDLSNNKLGQSIPKELGKLGGKCPRLYCFSLV